MKGRNNMEPIAYTYHADLYCADCGANLPDVDPEGHGKGAVFNSEVDYIPHCAGCGRCIEGYTLTDDGIAFTLDAVTRAAEQRDLTAAIREWAGALKDYERGMRPGDRALIAAVQRGDEDAAYALTRPLRDWTDDDLDALPVLLRRYWPHQAAATERRQR